MRPANTGLAPEGLPFIGLAAFTALLAAILEWWIVALICWLFMVFALYFFRDPERVGPQGTDLAVSPADGTVVRIGQSQEPFSGKDAQCVSIFMDLFSVHVNRAPVACDVMAIRYFPGKFISAHLDKASTDNERCAWLLKDDADRNWTAVQIAGLIARRIVCRAEPGDRLSRGERLGMIRFGSRVDLFLPEDYTPAVKVGAKVFAGETTIARPLQSEFNLNE